MRFHVRVSAWALLLAAAFVRPVGAADPPARHQRGYFKDVKLDAFYPGYSFKQFCLRMGEWRVADQDGPDGGPERMMMTFYVPKSYEPGKPHGLLFLLPTGWEPNLRELPQWAIDAADQHRLIAACAPGAKDSTGKYYLWQRTITAVSAPTWLAQRYTLDWDRTYTYAKGSSAGSHYAFHATVGFPELYCGLISEDDLDIFTDLPDEKMDPFADVDARTGKPMERRTGHYPYSSSPAPDAERQAYMKDRLRVVYRGALPSSSGSALKFYRDHKIAATAFVPDQPANQPPLDREIHTILEFLDEPAHERTQRDFTKIDDLKREGKLGDALELAYRADALNVKDADDAIEDLEKILKEQIERARRDLEDGETKKAIRRLEKVVEVFGTSAAEAQALLDDPEGTAPAAAVPVAGPAPPTQKEREKVAKDSIKPHQKGLLWSVSFGSAPVDLLIAKDIMTRTGYSGKLGPQELLAMALTMKFNLIVPDNYQAQVPHGLLVVTHDQILAQTTPEWQKAMAEQRMIMVVPARRIDAAPMSDYFFIIYTLAALHNVKRLYTVDPARVYLYSSRHSSRYIQEGREFTESDFSLALVLGYPELISGSIHMSIPGYWESFKNADPSIPPPTKPRLEAARDVRIRLVYDAGGNSSRDDFVRELKKQRLNADAVKVKDLYDALSDPVWSRMLTAVEKELRDAAAAARDSGPDLEKKGEFEAALLLWYRAQLFEDPKADDEIKRLRGILETQTTRAAGMLQNGETQDGEKLLRKIVAAFGLFATDAQKLLEVGRPPVN